MTRPKQLYSYYAGSGLETYHVETWTKLSVTVRHIIAGEHIRLTEVDVPGGRYFTTPAAAIKSFITKAETAIATKLSHDKSHELSAGDLAGWRKFLTIAKTLLREWA